MLSKDQILGASDLKTEVVKVPEWGGDITIREMSGKQRDVLDGLMAQRYNPKTQMMTSTKDLRARMVILSVIDTNTGEMMFTDKDTDAIGKKSGSVLDRVCEAISKLNGLGEDEIAEAEKN